MSTPTYNIAAVERDTGLSKDVLRVWERRYGFPVPERDGNGERLYPAEQVDRLRMIKRLMDQGHRPGKLIATPLEALASLPTRRPGTQPESARMADTPDLDKLLDFIRRHDGSGYQQAMQQHMARQGLLSFVQDTLAPLTRLVGSAWEQGSFEVYEEHLFTELTKRLLRQAIAGLPMQAGGPRILLTTVPEEKHILGLLMVEALMTLEGAECIPLGTQMPLQDIAKAAEAHRADAVALSFSAAFPQRQIATLLLHLRSILPARTALWAGGAGILYLQPPAGIVLLPTLEAARQAAADWRTAQPAT